ncbi:MAG: phage minor head protein [Sinimarinibacterium flocculans]|uniref:phage head morphogenesis protein n=1 Tax=Sinimarinibacterium flocculans TaxID=985250 RepID=UPI003C3D605B
MASQPELPDLGYAVTLPPEKAIAYFQQKGWRISWDWHDTLQEAHARAFTIARMADLDLLRDVRAALDIALSQGRTDRWFQKEITSVLQERGWWGKQEVEVQPGETREVQLGSPRRLQLIYRQNMQGAYMAGRFAELKRIARSRPYWQYIAVMDAKTRPTHAALHGKVFRHDDPIWQYIWPPNDWACRCRVRALSKRQVERLGLVVETSDGKLRRKMADLGVDWTSGEIRRIEVHGLRITGRDGKPTTFWPGAGFSYNAGMAAWAPDLDRYPADIARQYVEGSLTGPEFARWFSIWQRATRDAIAADPDRTPRQIGAELARSNQRSGMEYPVAVLREADRTALKTPSQSVLMSTGTLIEHLAAHPEIGLAEYQLLPRLFDQGEMYQQGAERIILLADGERLFRASIKVDERRQRLYLLSLFETNPKDADRQVRERYARIR